MIKTIFFDLDGVIIHSEPIHGKAKKLTLDEFGINYPPTIFDDYIGRTDEDFFRYASEKLDTQKHRFEILLHRKQDLFVELIPEMKLVDGFLSFFQETKNKGIKTALVSSTSTYTFDLIDKHFNITNLFDLLITQKDTTNHKPHPDPYIKALQTLPASTESTIVIEDSPNGITSAKNAGCKVYALTTSFKADKLTEADKIVNSYAELSEELRLT